MTKTSESDPLLIDSVAVPGFKGLIGMTICPGKKQPKAQSGNWDRDLELDLARIAEWGASMLVSLIEPHEYVKVGVQDMSLKLAPTIKHIKLPIKDFSIPDSAWEEAWKIEGEQIRAALKRGERVCIHCMGGIGRTGTIAAKLLVEFGLSPDEAIAAVRRARPGTIETEEQAAYVRSRNQ